MQFLLRNWEECIFIRHCHSLHLKIYFKMPENLLTTFVHAVDLIFDLSYLIKFFFFFFFFNEDLESDAYV